MNLWIIIAFVIAVFVIKMMMSSNISIKEAKKKLEENAVIVDVRTEGEFSSEHIDNALNIPHDKITELEAHVSDKNKPVLLYCLSGMRAAAACAELRKNGYSQAYNVGGYSRAKKII
jgi:rhodanese-related sulfurtransferase